MTRAVSLQCLILLAVSLAVVYAELAEVESTKRLDYTGYKLFRFKNDASSNTLEEMEKYDIEFDENTKTTRLMLDIWSEPNKMKPYAEILVAPEFIKKFMSMLTAEEAASLTIIDEDIQKEINKEQGRIQRIKNRKKRALKSWDDFNIHAYHTYDEMIEFMKLLSTQKSDMVDLLEVARSSEGRIVYGVKIHPPGVTAADRPSIITDAGVHAREWIAPAVALYMMKKVVADYGKNEKVTKSLNKFDWYIFPQVNPDGYEYSRTTDRLWRKTRSVNKTINKWCTGADANRNWGYRWGEVGANRTPCSNIYMGSHPYSEPEIKGLKDFFTWQIANPQIYVSLHSYGQLFLSPWGYTNEKTSNYLDQREAARVAVQAMHNTTGVAYDFGTISELMYPASGTSIDYMQHIGVPYIYGVELRPTDNPNGFEFNLPSEYIALTGNEMLAALFAMGDHAVKVKRL